MIKSDLFRQTLFEFQDCSLINNMAALVQQKLESSSIGIACILHLLVFGVYFFELLVILPKLYGDPNSYFYRLLHVSAGELYYLVMVYYLIYFYHL